MGEGTKRNHTLAADWYNKGAIQGDVLAQRNLGALYTQGEGVTKDLVEAYAWFVLSSRQGDDLARQNKIYITYDLSYSQIQDANKRADILSSKISDKKAEKPRSDLQILVDHTDSCAPMPDSTESNTLHFNGFSIDKQAGKSWCYSGLRDSGAVETRNITTAFNASSTSIKRVELTYLEEVRIPNRKKLLRFAKKNKLMDRVLGEKFGKVKYSSEKSHNANCISYKRYFSGKNPVADLLEGLLYGAQVLSGVRGANFTSGGYANGYGIQCVHPHDPAILVSAELIRISNKVPTKEDKKKLLTDANAFLNAIGFTELNI